MKLPKKIYIVCFCALVAFSINTSGVFAMKLTPFPDNSSLQPRAVPDARPNFSGNINSTVTVDESAPTQNQDSISETKSASEEVPNGTPENTAPAKKSDTSTRVIAYVLLALTAIITAVHFWKKELAKTAKENL